MWPSLAQRSRSLEWELPPLEPWPVKSARPSFLSAVDIFRDLPEGEVEALMTSTTMRTASKGTVFYGTDDGREMLFFLKSGSVELSRQSPDGRKLTLSTVQDGAFFGEMSLVGQSLSGTRAVANEDSVVCSLSRSDVESLVLEHPRVALRLIEVLARRLQEARDGLQEMAFNDVTGRVAGLLLRLDRQGTNVVEGYSHQELAAMVGCLRESLTVTLDRFKRSGALAVGRRRIEITDRAQLERVVSQRAGASS